eukprot:ANDGO_04813.mRNA.1 hypothetical protein
MAFADEDDEVINERDEDEEYADYLNFRMQLLRECGARRTPAQRELVRTMERLAKQMCADGHHNGAVKDAAHLNVNGN